MRRVSYTARIAQEAQQSDEIEVVLVIIEHPDIPGGILRLTSCFDENARISVEPLLYGMYSTWRTTGGEPFLFTMIDALVPDEKDDAPSQASLVLELLDSDMGDVLTSTTVQATCHMAVVMASSPNVVEGEWLHMLMTGADVNSSEAVLRFSTESLYDEPATANRMVKQNFPGLHR